MKKFWVVLLLLLLLSRHSLAQELNSNQKLSVDLPIGILASDSSVVVSSYFNSVDPRDEWTELLVVADNVDMRNWTLQDNNSTQTSWQPQITFNNIPFWNNMRSGSIIMIWHRSIGTAGNTHPADANKLDGYIETSANNVNYFGGGSFGTAPTFAGPTLNVAGAGDLIQLLNGSGVFVHALGHKTTFGTSWNTIPVPKLNHKASLADGEAVFVCPGNKMDEYGFNAPQDGTNWTAKSATDLSFGLPNCTSTSSSNSDYWRQLRQPRWINPLLTGTVNTGNTQVTLNWNAANDAFPGDATQGYLILRNNANNFGTPLDGHSYSAGDLIGSATVLSIIASSQTLTYTDNISVPCAGGYFYRIYAFRYSIDPAGNDFNLARGRAYNETNFGSCQVTYSLPVAPASAASDRNNFCADDPGNIALSATGGAGTILNWFSGSCGGTLIGLGTGTNNSITIPSPVATTTYYARWENLCGSSSCADVTVTVLPGSPVSVSIIASANPVCTGTSVTFTATPTNPGTSPIYQWKVNGSNAGGNSPTYTYNPLNGDNIVCILTSNASCASGNPATSNNIIMSVTGSLPVSVNIVASENPVCSGTSVIFTATPLNPGTAPTYQWKVNGANAGGNSPTYSYMPVNGDDIICILTSDASCASGNPATSNNIIISVTGAIPVAVSIAASENPVCTGTSVTFTATPTNPGSAPVYQWKVNGINVGGNSPAYSYIPLNGDNVTCVLTSNSSCASGNPATSNTIVMSVNSSITVSVDIAASENPVCAETSVTFTATPVNPGPAPAYEWFLNGTLTGTNNSSLTYLPADGDNIYCILTSSASCASGGPATSSTITMLVSTAIPVGVTIAASENPVCSGTVVTYTATPVNAGSSPSFQWILNGNPVGGNNPLWSNVPANSDAIRCVVTSNSSCATNNPATSETITMTISSALVAEVTVVSNHTMMCEGTDITFTASPVNEGSAPTYQWLVDGTLVQQGVLAVYQTNTLLPGQTVTCILTSSLSCVAQQTVTSLPLTINAAPLPVVILSDKDFICTGTTTPLDAGAGFSSYLWQDGSSSRYLSISSEGIYRVNVNDSLGCSGSDSILVKSCSGNIYVPNSFTPNGDGLNDIFRVIASPDDIAELTMHVFNRWGEQIFLSENLLTGWDGLKQGQYCPEGTYAWIIHYKTTTQTDETLTLKGTVELIR